MGIESELSTPLIIIWTRSFE